MTRRFALLLSAASALSACALHHVTPYVPDAANAPQTEDAAQAGTNCFEAGTAAETAICAAPSLAGPNRAMVQALQAGLRASTIFGRDALLASQRGWLLGLPAQCHLPESPAHDPLDMAQQPDAACLHSALADRTAMLRAWPLPRAAEGGAIAQYVTLRDAAGAGRPADPAFCHGFARRANLALSRTGMLDPAAMGMQEVAGSHGPQAALPVSVDLYDANAYGLFQRRARGATLDGRPILSPTSLTQLLEAQNTANQGGRFSSFASQTGDYGSIDVFRDDGRLLALAADAWGSDTPAPPGEAAHAGLWDIGGAQPASLCVFDTYTRPAEPGPFDTLPDYTAWRDVLSQIRDSADLPLGIAFKRDQGQLMADTSFILLHMPLLAVEQAGVPGATLWLRHRHDEVLDALFAWSAKAPANKLLFDRIFGLLRPAAAELVHAYQATQGLSGTEATRAGGITVMELLYQASTTIAPSLGAQPDVPSATKPRYPILALPQ